MTLVELNSDKKQFKIMYHTSFLYFFNWTNIAYFPIEQIAETREFLKNQNKPLKLGDGVIEILYHT